MPPQLDPIMGVPIIGTSDELDQIPMDSQVFPYDDLKATDKPGRGPAYPDDILPTSAVLVGQNQNNPQQVQTLYTDGNHNLRIALQGGGGGSGAIVQQSAPGLYGGVANNSSWTLIGGQGAFDATYTLLTGVALMVRPDPAHLPGASTFCLWGVALMDSSFTNIVAVGVGQFYQSDYSGTLAAYSISVPFTPPIDAAAVFGDVTSVVCVAHANPGGIRLGIRALYGV